MGRVLGLVGLMIIVLSGVQAAKRYTSNVGDTFPAWAFLCRCTSGCDTETGECLNSGSCISGQPAEYPWSGTACRTGNRALGKQTSSIGYDDYSPDRAVNGRINPDRNQGDCSITKSPDNSAAAWWQVDLEATHQIDRVIIYNEQGRDHNSLRDFNIHNGDIDRQSEDAIIYKHGSTPVQGFVTIEDGSSWTGRFVSIIRQSDQEDKYLLPLCEVVVIGRKVIDCQWCPDAACDDFNGCSKCDLGKKLPDCRESCDENTYGDNCEQKCSYHCKSGAGRTCDIKTGVCTGDCDIPSSPGSSTLWLGDKCDIEIPPIHVGSSDNFPKTPYAVTSTSVTWRWQELTEVSPEAESFIFYKIQYSTYQNTRMTKSEIPFTVSADRWQQGTVTGLEPETIYYFNIIVYRKYNQEIYQSPYDSEGHHGLLKAETLSGLPESTPTTPTTTTHALSSTAHSQVLTTESHSQTGVNSGVIAGSIVGTLVFITLVVVIIILVIRVRSLSGPQRQPEPTSQTEEYENVDDVTERQHVYQKPEQIGMYGNAGVEGPYAEIQPHSEYEQIRN